MAQESYPEFFDVAEKLFLLENGSDSKIVWLPSPCLQSAIDVIDTTVRQILNPLDQHPRAIDLACGLGRDATFLAIRGWEVTAVDYLEKQISRVPQFASRYAADHLIKPLLLDLEATSYPLTVLPDDHYHLVNVARYLHRPLFSEIKRIIAPGGYICYHTFMDGCQDTKIGRPRRPQFLLQHGELRNVFSPPEFDCIMDTIHMLPDSRPTSLFVARKRLCNSPDPTIG